MNIDEYANDGLDLLGIEQHFNNWYSTFHTSNPILFVNVDSDSAWKKASQSPSWDEISVSKLISINENQPLRVVGSRSHADPKMALWLERYQPHQLIGVDSSLKFCMVAEGEADIYPRHGTTCIWDTAAGHAVLVAAGGDVFQLDGELLTYTDPAQTKNASFVALANKVMFLEYQPFE